MKYIYGEFSDKQIEINAKLMHNEIHKLLIYKDPSIEDKIFESNEDFIIYFINLLLRYGGLNELLGEPKQMVAFMSTLQAALDEVVNEDFNYNVYRKLILDAHGYIKSIFEEGGDCHAKL